MISASEGANSLRMDAWSGSTAVLPVLLLWLRLENPSTPHVSAQFSERQSEVQYPLGGASAQRRELPKVLQPPKRARN